MNFDKLMPAPLGFSYDGSSQWSVGPESCPQDGEPHICVTGEDEEARAMCEFIALARNAFDVMMRRGWHVEQTDPEDKEEKRMWFVPWPSNERKTWPDVWMNGKQWFADPFTALVEADRWCKENVEKKCDPHVR